MLHNISLCFEVAKLHSPITQVICQDYSGSTVGNASQLWLHMCIQITNIVAYMEIEECRQPVTERKHRVHQNIIPHYFP